MSPGARSQAATYVKIVGRRIAIKAVTFGGVKEPRLRFDRTAVGLISRLQAALVEGGSVEFTNVPSNLLVSAYAAPQ